ncbi:hypothetical protein AMELA_G00222170 [Ameiurus melas]|uniref:Uncharacterized protein n=1 Tax=Ameiurus melas TaxID=219545 RepID=A0A7J5ZZ60_AMEME|nr:hypothetical protein AMELA_G00222170 [Ameiurus melas]
MEVGTKFHGTIFQSLVFNVLTICHTALELINELHFNMLHINQNQHIHLTPPGLGVRFPQLSCVCGVCMFSPGVSSGYSGFLPQAKDMHGRPIGMSKVPVVYECVCDCAL